MKTGRILAVGGSVAALAAAGILMTAFLGKATGYNTDTAGYRSISEDVEATGDVHGVDSTTYYSQVTAPISFYDLKTGDEEKRGDMVVQYDL